MAARLASSISNNTKLARTRKLLIGIWLYLHSMYPMLTCHIAELAASSPAPLAHHSATTGAPEPFQSCKSIQFIRSISHLLDDAERITAAAAAAQQLQQLLQANNLNHHQISNYHNNYDNKQQPQRHNHQRHSSAWLTRVNSNPFYSKLVQHLRAKQNQLNYQQQQRPVPSLGDVPAGEAPGDEANTGGNGAKDDGEQMASLDSQQQPSQQQPQTQQQPAGQEVYGRLINYPHEIGLVDNSHGMARTLDKLRLLNHHSKQQQQQLSGGDITETNRIPLASDVDQMSDGDWRKLGESATDLARNNFVYGTVLLRPSSTTNNRADQEHRRHQQRQLYPRPMSTLRELANEQERQRLMLLNNRPSTSDTINRDLDGGSSNTGGQSSPSVSSSSSNIFGRVLNSPPSANSNNNDKSDLKQMGSHDGSHVASVGYAAAADGSAERMPDELANQQRAGQVAIDGGGTELEQLPSSNNNDEFEGEFHSGPLQQAEVRLLRSLDSGKVTTGDKLLQPQVELTTMKAEFVID